MTKRAWSDIATRRQREAWPEAIERLNRYAPVHSDPDHSYWLHIWEQEVRPGRGHSLTSVWCDGEQLAEVHMDVYGAPSVGIADIEWKHSDEDEECCCDYCVTERKGDQ